jgi:phospholipid/cholesterol/gamma-HCH transport system substrate-binding protein
MVGFALSCFGLLLFLWLAFGGPIPFEPKGYQFKIQVHEATNLANEADVRISGVPVGKVKNIQPHNGATQATIQLDPKFAPISKDAKAMLRQKTLLGETYVELTPGDPGSPKVPEDGMLANTQVAPTVELDEIFRTFNPRTREAFQTWMQDQARAVAGQGENLSNAIGNLPEFETDTNTLLQILNTQQGAVQRLVADTGVVFDALTERDGQLRSLIENSNRVFETTAARNADLQQIFEVLPTFEKESQATLVRLDRFAHNTNPLIDELRPAAQQISPTLIELEKLAPDLEHLFVNLGPLVTASRAGLPAVDEFLDDLRPLLGQFSPFLRQINPILYGLSNYPKEINAFFSNTVAATEATDKPPKSSGVVHYLRTTNPINPEGLAATYPNRIGSNRPNPYTFPGVFANLAQGLQVYENRGCGNGIPQLTNQVTPLITDLLPTFLRDEINTFVYGGTESVVPAPPCVLQGKFPATGDTSFPPTQYPQVRANPPAR